MKAESHSKAWSRAHNFRKHHKRGWQSDTACPLRLRGYTELFMRDLDERLRKKIDTALKRGYTLENRTQLPSILSIIREWCPVGSAPIGYIGKTELSLFVPTEDDAKDLAKELRATTVMTDAFDGDHVKVHGQQHGYWRVTAFLYYEKKHKHDPVNLRARFSELRPAIDEWMQAFAAVERENMARWCADDESVIRIPFDSHVKRYEE